VLPKIWTDADVEDLFRNDPYRLHQLRRTRLALYWELEDRALRLGFIVQKIQSGSPEARFRN
jgi:hypothetical protein